MDYQELSRVVSNVQDLLTGLSRDSFQKFCLENNFDPTSEQLFHFWQAMNAQLVDKLREEFSALIGENIHLSDEVDYFTGLINKNWPSHKRVLRNAGWTDINAVSEILLLLEFIVTTDPKYGESLKNRIIKLKRDYLL